MIWYLQISKRLPRYDIDGIKFHTVTEEEEAATSFFLAFGDKSKKKKHT